MTAEQMLELAERVEKASGPDRELDALIRCEVHEPWEWDIRPAKKLGMVTARYEDGGHGTWISPRYTASLDAAMTLVPEGWAIERWQIWPGQPSTLSLYETREAATGERYRGGGEAMAHASAATPALALCSAALRSRAAILKQGEVG